MTAYEKLKAARHNHRPTGAAYVNGIFHDCIELHGDRRFGDDPAILSGIGWLGNFPVTYIAIDKGTNIHARIQKNFGCPKPEGYRKGLRLMKQAEKFNRPIICFVDTQGAFCGAEAEERGQGEAIAENILEMMGLRVPVISVVIGEGGSGGALALASANRVYMLENAVYSVISPEGCASILWKDAARVEQAADVLHITADDMHELGVAEEVIHENFENFPTMCTEIRNKLMEDVQELSSYTPHMLQQTRYDRFRRFGIYHEGT